VDIELYILGSVALVSIVSLVGVLFVSARPKSLTNALAFLVPLAVGALLGDAFFHLIPQVFSAHDKSTTASLGVIVGIVSFFLLEKFLRRHHHSIEISSEKSEGDTSKNYLGSLVLVSDSLHNFIDGIIIGTSYLLSVEVGIATTLAIIMHEIPQEIGDFGILIYAGYSRARALFYNFLSALTAILGALIIIVLGSLPETFIQIVTAFAAGVFIYIASSDLVPELHKNIKGKNILLEVMGMSLGLLAMYLLLFLE
jgi:zinc and cadmium transporter